jgi:ATP-dependent RNA helicase RhlE
MHSKGFYALGLSGALVRVLEGLRLTEPTEIQYKTIPPALAGRDVLASAETGSGKTAAFMLPLIERLKQPTPGKARALVLAPTRELALQIAANACLFSRASRLRTVALVGGESVTKQLRLLAAGADMLIATPGRLNDFILRGVVRFESVEVLVLDEADRMLDMGFLPQVRRIMQYLPCQRQTMLLAATMSHAVEQLAHELMTEPVRVEVGRPSATVATLTQSAYSVLSHAKVPLLLRLLEQNGAGSFLVFMETKRGADRVARALAAHQHCVDTMHSNRTQSQRNRALANFKSGQVRVLVATDVAARGIDVDDISHVVNYEVPSTVEDYLHRVGRTARAGRQGSAVTLVSPEEEPALAMIERSTGQQIPRSKLHGFSDGRSDHEVSLAMEIGRLRGNYARSFKPRRASR